MQNEKAGKQKQSKADSARPHITRGNVFADLGFSPAEALALRFKTDCHTAIMRIIRERGYDQRELQRILDQPQPRISELMNGKISKMSLEKLLAYFSLLGGQAKLVMSKAKTAA